MKINRILAAFLAVLMMLAVLVSCGKEDETVLSIGGFDVPYHVYRYIAVNSRRDVEAQFGEDVWSSDKADEARAILEGNVKDSLLNLYTVCSLGADFGVSWSDDVVSAQAELQYQSAVAEYENEREFKKSLEEMAMTEDTFRFILSNSILNNEAYAAMIASDKKYTDKEYLQDIFDGDEFIRVKQILVGDAYSASDEAKLEKAQDIKASLDAGEDFDDLCRAFNNDLYMFENDDGYYIMRGTRNFEFEEAAFALAVGETGDIVKTDVGYSIIKRYEKDAEYIAENFDALAAEYYESVYSIMYEERYEKLSGELKSLPEAYDVTEIE